MVKQINLTLFLLLGVFAVGLVILKSIENIGFDSFIWIEAETADKISGSLEIVELDNASENEGIVTVGRHQGKNGFATYSFNIEKIGKYWVWARCYWPHVCANGFFTTIDNEPFSTLGQNPVTNRWHWIVGPVYDLKNGTHKLILRSDERDAKIDKFLITANPNFFPSGYGLSNDYFLNFENGILPNEIYFKNKGKWEIIKNDKTGNNLLHLKPLRKSNLEVALLTLPDPTSYSFNMAYKCISKDNGNLMVFYNYKDSLNNLFLNIDGNETALYGTSNGKTEKIKTQTIEYPFLKNKLNYVSFSKMENSIKIKHNGKTIFSFPDSIVSKTQIGIGSTVGNLEIDNMSLTSGNNIGFNYNFHEKRLISTYERPETSPRHFENLKKQVAEWWVIDGDWSINENCFETLHGKPLSDTPALILIGNDFWNNYSIKMAIKPKGEGGIGVFFYYQDHKNYLLFKWEKEKKKWYYRISKVQNGIETILTKLEAPPIKTGFACWYKLEVRLKDGQVCAYIDNKQVAYADDNTFDDGRIGFWTSCKEGAEFDDIHIAATNNLYLNIPEELEYRFGVNMQISLDISDWDFSSKTFFQPNMRLNKELIESSFMYNKRSFQNDLGVLCHFADIPYDVDINLSFSGFKYGVEKKYNFIIGQESITILKNGIEKNHIKLSGIKRQEIRLNHAGTRWELKIGKETIPFDDILEKANFDFIKIGVGLSGIGATQTRIPYILINNSAELLLSQDSHEN